MNWGKGIVIGMSAFMIFIVVLVVILMRQSVDLVSTDYYAKEISYQDEITAVKNADELSEKVVISKSDEHLVIQLPGTSDYSNVTVQLDRPNNDELDKKYDVKASRTFLIDKKELTPGLYNVQIHFSDSKKHYLQKEQIYI